MQLHSVNNSQPSFGMALKVEGPKACQKFAKLIGMDKHPNIAKRGLKRFAASQAKNPYDIIYDRNRFDIIKDKVIIDSVEIERKIPTGKNDSTTLGEAIKKCGKRLYKAIFEPEAFLPKELKTAADLANKQAATDAKLAAEVKQGEIVEKILSKFNN